ncbi:MAG: hypothetical protein UT50_C0018G0009 [Candidatus Moranbacteria bacterium GW2011_GWA2_39_41]|nr:MAG: hypothetical protein UT50_C0018G0009 [Candidatus Moranbacteria bacterium GW2011_GWA2_39_41]
MENYSNNQEEKSWMHMRINFGVALLIVLILSGGVWKFLHDGLQDFPTHEIDNSSYARLAEFKKRERLAMPADVPARHFSPGPISMDLMKSNGCVADGLLSGYGEKIKEIINTINRSECAYLHRSLETWLKVPDFSQAFDIMERVENRPIVYGMFLAEAISTRKKYADPNSGETFQYEQMCREGTEGRWGTDTCIPSVQNVEYRRYLKAVTRRAMDVGIQSFLFGQIMLQDENYNFEQTEMKKILADMRQYAKERGMQIVVGAQTDEITDERYLRMFDYIEGGVGVDDAGNVENQPCFSGHANCWALLWHERYSSKANNVLLHLDWSGLVWDDMGVFARMTKEKRIETLANLYQKFTSQNMGFMMPYLAVLNHDNDGCYGPNKHFYAPSKKYKCKDENAIKKIMRDVAL